MLNISLLDISLKMIDLRLKSPLPEASELTIDVMCMFTLSVLMALQKRVWAHKSGSSSIFTSQRTTHLSNFNVWVRYVLCGISKGNILPVLWKIRFLYIVENLRSQIYELICIFETPPGLVYIWDPSKLGPSLCLQMPHICDSAEPSAGTVLTTKSDMFCSKFNWPSVIKSIELVQVWWHNENGC